MEKVICCTRGEARGNPGPAAIGVYITDAKGTIQTEFGKSIGNGTDNFAAYYAVMVGLQTLLDMLGTTSLQTEINLRLENEMVKKQLNAELPINDPGLVPMFIEIHNLQVVHFPYLTLTFIPCEENKDIIRLISEAQNAKY